MAIPEHVKRQAMDAVSHKETTAMIRAYRDSGIEASRESAFTHAQALRPENRPIPDEVKRKAMDAVSHPETAAQIRLIKYDGHVTAPITPGRETDRVAGKIAQMHGSGHDLNSTHKTMTQDGFGREYV